MGTIQDRIKELGVINYRAESPRIVERGKWKGFTRWDIFIPKTKGLVSTFHEVFHMGPGHKGAPPDLETVLDCLFRDAATVENTRDQEEYCREFSCSGKLYALAASQRDRLKAWVDDDALWERCLWDTDNL